MKYSNQTVKAQGDRSRFCNLVSPMHDNKKLSQSNTYVDDAGAPAAPPPVKPPPTPKKVSNVAIYAGSVG